mgnify:CR=1 FL=1
MLSSPGATWTLDMWTWQDSYCLSCAATGCVLLNGRARGDEQGQPTFRPYGLPATGGPLDPLVWLIMVSCQQGLILDLALHKSLFVFLRRLGGHLHAVSC